MSVSQKRTQQCSSISALLLGRPASARSQPPLRLTRARLVLAEQPEVQVGNGHVRQQVGQLGRPPGGSLRELQEGEGASGK